MTGQTARPCVKGRPTRRIVRLASGPHARCPRCRQLVPAAQVPRGQERRNTRGEITASYAALPHNRPATP